MKLLLSPDILQKCLSFRFFGMCCFLALPLQLVGLGTEFFPQSVASGDPTPDSVVLWTRLVVGGDTSVNRSVSVSMVTAPNTALLVGASSKLSGEPVYQRNDLKALGQHDGCVKLRVTGLVPDTIYYFQFSYKSENSTVYSAVGRTRTAPAPDNTRPVQFAVFNCADYNGRYYNPLKHLVEQATDDLDFILHLGDYIYETVPHAIAQAESAIRSVKFSNPTEAISLGNSEAARSVSNYRDLYKTYRSDPFLMRAHELFPWVVIWDDHEFSGDYHGATGTYFDGQVDEFDEQRKHNAEQAWMEFIPCDVGLNDAGHQLQIERSILFPNTQIYRSLSFGANLDLLLTDNRTFRQDHVIPEDAYPGRIVMEETITRLAVNTVFGAGTFDTFRDQLDPYVIYGQPISYFDQPIENHDQPNLAFQNTPFEGLSFAEALEKIIQTQIATALETLPEGKVPLVSAADYALNVVNQPMSATWINNLFRGVGFPAPISDDTLSTLRRGVSYLLLGKTSPFSEIGSRYQVVDPSFQLLAGFQYQAFLSTGGLLGEDQNFYGEPQEAFIRNALAQSVQRDANWRLVASSSPFTPLHLNLADVPEDLELPDTGQISGDLVGRREVIQSIPDTFKIPILLNADEVSGFPSYRQEMVDLLAENDAVVLSGDIHASMMGINKSSEGKSVIDFSVPSTASSDLGRALNGALQFIENLIADTYRQSLKDPSIQFKFDDRENFLSIIQKLILHNSDQLDYLNASTQGYLHVRVEEQEMTGEFREIRSSNVRVNHSNLSDLGTDALFARKAFVLRKTETDLHVESKPLIQAYSLQPFALEPGNRMVFPEFLTESDQFYRFEMNDHLSSGNWAPLIQENIQVVNGAKVDENGWIEGTGEQVSAVILIPDAFTEAREVFIRVITEDDD